MGMVNLIGLTNQVILGILKTIIFTEKEFTNGMMAENFQEIGSSTKCMGKEYLSGRMEDNILENIMMIKNKVKENFFGQMEENFMVSG